LLAGTAPYEKENRVDRAAAAAPRRREPIIIWNAQRSGFKKSLFPKEMYEETEDLDVVPARQALDSL
jgi:hypothetical protein